jgi:NADPH:quinone reductase-like Zn-dependent oxidoreductase
MDAMRAIEVIAFGGPEKLRLMDVPEPTAEADQVRVGVAAVTVNPTDATTAAGVFRDVFPQIQPPFIPGWDLAGTLLDATGDADYVKSLGADQVLERSSDLVDQVRRAAPEGSTAWWIVARPGRIWWRSCGTEARSQP